MLFSFAPMEGVTSCLFRQTHAACFPGVDRYYAPFLAPDGSGVCKQGAWRDLRPENNPGPLPVPQVLCNKAEAFLAVARELQAMGYTELNLNAGCPSSTVVPKHKGAGMLQDLRSLDDFLADVFSRCELKISVKTRLGLESSEEFPAILEVYRKYPLAELIIHARDRKGMYKSKPELDAFAAAFPLCPFPVCYNGSLVDGASLEELTARVPELARVMVGRGAMGRPWIFREIRHFLETGEVLPEPDIKERMEIMLRHCSYLCKYKGEVRGMKEARKNVAWYVKGLPNSAKLRAECGELSTYAQAEEMAERIISREAEL